MVEFKPFAKIPRLSREIVVTEKIDGTNASIFIQSVPGTVFKEDGPLVAEIDGMFIYAASRTRWIKPGDDNFGFASWVAENAEGLAQLGPGHHFGEWWGSGVQRGYDLDHRRFSLFNVSRWVDRHTLPNDMAGCSLEPNQGFAPDCCHVVPVLYTGPFNTAFIDDELIALGLEGSKAAPGFMEPEGVVVYHEASGHLYKKTCEYDAEPKSMPKKPRPEAPPREPQIMWTGGRRVKGSLRAQNERRVPK